MIISATAQNTDPWKAERHGIATASDFSRIITAKTGATSSSAEKKMADMLAESYCQSIDTVNGFTEDTGKPCDCEHLDKWEGNGHIDRGNRVEPIAIKALSKELKRLGMASEIESVGLMTQSNGVLGCSADGMIRGPGVEAFNRSGESLGEFSAGVEVKSASLTVQNLRLFRKVLPPEHAQQVHGCLAVTGLPMWHYFSYAGETKAPLHVIVEPNDYTRKVRQALVEFISRYQEFRGVVVPLHNRYAELYEEEDLV